MNTHEKRGAFTLIELLIVVAIIAILAAIAVPNFLEAQTRAKVSRVKADMRSMATAIESYRIDYNNYVRSTFDGTDTPPVAQDVDYDYTDQTHIDYIAQYRGYTGTTPGNDQDGGFFNNLSTPVAYIANSYMVDPFAKQDVKDTKAEYLRYTAWGKNRITGYATTPTLDFERGEVIESTQDQIAAWALWSVGPGQKDVCDPYFISQQGVWSGRRYYVFDGYYGTRGGYWYVDMGADLALDRWKFSTSSNWISRLDPLKDMNNEEIATFRGGTYVYNPVNGSISDGHIFQVGGGIPGGQTAAGNPSGLPNMVSGLGAVAGQ